jgi:outer membrane protein
MVWQESIPLSKNAMSRWLVTLVICLVSGLIPQETSAQDVSPVMTLEESIEIALKRNLDIQVAQEEIEAAYQRKKEQGTNFLPKFKVEYGYRRPSETEITFGGVTFENTDENQWRLDGIIELPLFTGFSNLSTYQLAELGLDVAQIQLAQTRLDIILQVKEAYFGILRAEKIREVAEQSVRQLQEGVRVAKNFFKVGMSPKIDVLDAETRLGDADLQLIRAVNDLQVAEARFNTILRQPITTPVDIEDTLTTEPYDKTYADSREIALKHRPEVLEATRNVVRADKEITLAKSSYYPTITWSLNYYRRGDDPTVDGSEFTDREFWETGATATWTIFEWGKTRYAANQRRARLRQAKEILQQVKDDVSLEVKTSFLTLLAAERAISVAAKSVESAEENFRISGERYEEQVATATEVLDAQTRLTEAKSNYANVLVAFNVARAQLVRAMGLEKES